jgi:hypothetical protein
MYRNDTGIPFFALLGSAALFLAAWLDGRYVGQLAHKPLASLTTGQIAMLAFAILLLIYGVIGYLSVWFEGRELRPGRRAPDRPGIAVLLLAALLTVALVADAGLLVRIIARASSTTPSPDALEGGVLSAMFIVVAALLILLKKYLMAREVLVEDAHDEVPW